MRFLADMGVALRVARWLREAEHDVTHLAEEGLARLPNGRIFAQAFDEQRIILTFDLDFAEIVALSGGQNGQCSAVSTEQYTCGVCLGAAANRAC